MKKRTTDTVLLSKRIKNIAIDKGIKIKDLTNNMGVNRNFLRETNQFTYGVLASVCKHLGVSVYELIEDENFKRMYDDKGVLIRIDRIA